LLDSPAIYRGAGVFPIFYSILQRGKKKRSICQTNKEVSRRQLLKALAATGGATALAGMSGQWLKPVVEVGLLPAHAQGSAVGYTLTASYTCASTGITNITATMSPPLAGVYIGMDVFLNGSYLGNGYIRTNVIGTAAFWDITPGVGLYTPGVYNLSFSFMGKAIYGPEPYWDLVQYPKLVY
jgi:hypothetical protein